MEAGAKTRGPASPIVLIARLLHAAVKTGPALSAVAAGVVGDDMAVVGDPHPHPRPVRIGWPSAFDAVLMGDEALRIEAEAAIEPVVVEEDQPRGAARRNLYIAFEAIGLDTRDRQPRR